MLGPYLARIGLTLAKSALAGRAAALEELRLPMRVWPTDIDTYFHVNNGVYLTLMDQGRLEHALRTGLMRLMLERRWKPLLGAATVRFRRELRVLQRFELSTRVATWDPKWVYFVQRFERSGVVHAEGFAKAVVKRGQQTVPPAEIMAALGCFGEPPRPIEALAVWITSQRSGSAAPGIG